ncbi:MAG: M1 family metallopeptidase [Bacteroidales bacterium]|nr:M1 family metallopeptidase [Bacteroidales bacterium]
MKNLFIVGLLIFNFNLLAQHYFQQKVDFDIRVTLNPSLKVLKGYEKITYYNNSPDTLYYIFFHLYPNATKSKTQTALARQMLYNKNYSLYHQQEEHLGFIDSLAFKINGMENNFSILKDSLDIGILRLNKPLAPHEHIIIETPFYVKIPIAGLTRMGYYESNFGITQWYPKPAVYDNKGWHPYPYLNDGEFYSEFGNYNVEITVPIEYTIAATGNLKDTNEQIRLNNLISLSKQYSSSEEYINALSKLSYTSQKFKTLRFIQDSIHDFAWFASPYFKVAKDSAVINDKIIYTYAFYSPENHLIWHNAAKFVSDAVQYYSNNVGIYPYKQCTAVEMPYITEGGMEYPTITSIGIYHDENSLQNVILHEVGHNWFYGILASNERNEPWIDEGINSFYESNYYPTIPYKPRNDWEILFNLLNTSKFNSFLLIDYFYFSGNARPIGLKSEYYNQIEYYFNAYHNTKTVWHFIKNYMTDSIFNRAMQSFYAQKAFQHIHSLDLKNHFSTFTNKSLNWYFNDYLYNTHRSDYKIKHITFYEDSIDISIKNKNKTAFPFSLSLYDLNNQIIKDTLLEGNVKNFSINLKFSPKHLKKIIINSNESHLSFIESNYSNNLYNHRKFLPRLKPLSIRLAGFIDKPQHYDILVYPLSGFNYIDKNMIGLVFYAPQIPYPSFQFRLMPMYSIKNKSILGSYYAEKFWSLNKTIRYIKSNILYQSYSYPNNKYQKLWQDIHFSTEIPLTFYKMLDKCNITYQLTLDYATLPFYPYSHELYFKNSLKIEKQFQIYQTQFTTSLENHSHFAKVKLNGHLFFPFKNLKKGFEADYFLGFFIFNRSNYFIYNLFLSGTIGINDYLYQDVFVDRFYESNHTFWQHQFIQNDGMFSSFIPISSNHWMTSLRTTLAFPFPPPLYLYGTMGTYYQAKNAWVGSTQFPWEIGFEFRIIKNIFAVYLPVKMSKDISEFQDFMYGDTYISRIRFMFRLSALNPFKSTQKIHTFIE